MTKPEQRLQQDFCEFLKGGYPDVYFMSDPSGLRVTMGIRLLIHRTRSQHAALDVVILEPRREHIGLIIELKSKSPYQAKNGELFNDDHLRDQKLSMDLLESKGFKCYFAWELEQAKNYAISYLGQPRIDDSPLF